MHRFEVGKPYAPNLPLPLPEGAEYNFDGQAHVLKILYQDPTAQEIKDIKSGSVRFQLLVEGDLIVPLFKFGDQNWMEAIYSYWMLPEQYRALPPVLEPGQSMVLTVFLINADTGILEVIRTLSTPEAWVKRLHAAIAAQSAQPINRHQYDSQVTLLQTRSTTKDLVDRAMKQK
jgi:hypothetical protein